MTLNSVGRSETVSTNVGQATQLNRTKAEQIGTIDNLTRFLNKTFDEGLVVKDADKREVNRSIEELVGFNNRVKVLQELFRNQAEQIDATDQLSFLLLSDLPESISMIDQSRNLTAKPISDSVGAEDIIERIGAFERLQEETTQLSDETTQFTAKSFIEQTNFTDFTDSLLAKSLLESLPVDDRERKSVLVDFDETLQFNINLLSERASFVRQVENISPQDAPVGRSAQLLRNRSETFQLQDFLNRQLDLFREVAEDVSLQDSLSFLMERRQTAITSLVDTQSTLTQKAVQESFDAFDEVSRFATLLRRQTAVVSVLDSNIIDIAKPLFEGIDISDSVVREADYSRQRQEQVDLTDLQLTKYLTLKKEQVRVEENRQLNLFREVVEDVRLQDSIRFLMERSQTAIPTLVDTQSTLTQRAVRESFDAIDEVSKVATLLRRRTAVLSVLDSDTKDIAKPLFEGIDVNDSVFRKADYSRRRLEQVDLTDLQLTKYLTFKQEQVGVEDNVLRVSEYLRELSQTIDLKDRFDFLYRARLAETVTFDIDLIKLISLREEAKINTQPSLEFRKFFPEVPFKSIIEFISDASRSNIEFISDASKSNIEFIGDASGGVDSR